MALEFIIPEIFDKNKILSGVTQKNMSLFPKYGLSLSKGEILTDDDLMLHQRVFSKLLGISNANMKYQLQTHGTNIVEVFSDSSTVESDGIYTQEKGLVLNVKIADCAGILIFDPTNEIIMALHSGWKGTQQDISSKGISILKERFNSNVEELLVYISPCASGDNYQVGEDVAAYFETSITKISDRKYLFDNKNEIKNQLLNCGIIEKNIEISKICTINDTLYHSFRRDKELSGRMSAFIGMLKNEELS